MKELTKKQKIRRIAESAVMLALATVLSELAVVKLPYGGSVTLFSQVPMIALSYRYGVKWGAFSGMAMGIVQMLFGLNNFSYVSGVVAYLILIFADYVIAFGCLGFGGMFRGKIENPGCALALGGAVVSVIRFVCHFISGVTIWGDYSGGAMSAVWYSVTYNASYMLPELIVTLVGCGVIGSMIDLSSPELRVRKAVKKEN
ncbi:MAG: energy-coupled thiamine transporter ThiT [Clostridia bacterium]|nr:energy-coupled thiamine transporter ThiT [Clostridia bacterium]